MLYCKRNPVAPRVVGMRMVTPEAFESSITVLDALQYLGYLNFCAVLSILEQAQFYPLNNEGPGDWRGVTKGQPKRWTLPVIPRELLLRAIESYGVNRPRGLSTLLVETTTLEVASSTILCVRSIGISDALQSCASSRKGLKRRLPGSEQKTRTRKNKRSVVLLHLASPA